MKTFTRNQDDRSYYNDTAGNKSLRIAYLLILVAWFVMVFPILGLAEPNRADEEYFNPPSLADNKKTSWAFAIDNDILVPGSRDQDYTYGFNLTLTGDSTENHWTSLHRPLDLINASLGLAHKTASGIRANKVEYGLFGFTPEDITLSKPQQTDRPYSSLIYVSSSREIYHPTSQVSWQSTLTLGVLGLGIVGELQNSVHSAVNGTRPAGWSSQISQGGEVTARYAISRQKLRYQSQSGIELKSTLHASIGYLTEASWSLSTRAGKIQTPWVSFNPELTSYGEKSIPNTKVKVSEQYGWAGVSIKFRVYNAFLQGQFKNSEISYDRDELNHVLLEAWLGYTLAFNDGYSFSYSIRGHTSELKSGIGDRSVVWGGILLSKTFG